jgi:hypothetical protein
MKQGEALHCMSIVRLIRGESVRHLEEFRIRGFKIADRFPGELLVSDSIDARHDQIARFRGDPRQWAEDAGLQWSQGLCRPQSIKHSERCQNSVGVVAYPTPT